MFGSLTFEPPSRLVPESECRRGFVCCFCGKEAVESDFEPVVITASFRDEHVTQLSCHVDCLGERLDKGIPYVSLKELEERAT